VLSLPIFPELTLEQQHQVVQGLCQLIGTKANGTATDNGTANANGTTKANGTGTANATSNGTANATATSTVMDA
jgi:hypothetical protein